jgi:hypothetical protein
MNLISEWGKDVLKMKAKEGKTEEGRNGSELINTKMTYTSSDQGNICARNSTGERI